MELNLSKNLIDEIKGYCEANDIRDYEQFIIKLVRDGFTTVKYGVRPMVTTNTVEIQPEALTPIIEPDKVDDKVIEDVNNKLGIFNKDIYGE
jgi:predicted transcriptional regulator